ncbi:MAG TPA: sulfotransferase family protein, partial [Thermoanaerobaculia bacterium]
MKRIHIVGVSPRSGTTLLAELMIACFEVDLHEEHEASLFTEPSRAGDLYLTKQPRDIMVVGPRLRVDPDLWVICMI